MQVKTSFGFYLPTRIEKTDVIVAVGGGSVLDSAKAIAVLQTHGGCVRDYEGRGKITREITPLVAIPTTAGTGSEVTRSSVITDTESMAPRLAIVDPDTTRLLPPATAASTGMDALVHAVEAFTCRPANQMSDVMGPGGHGQDISLTEGGCWRWRPRGQV